MLQIKSTANNTGVAVSGNYDDLNELYNALLCVIGAEGEFFYEAASRLRVLSVCHEIRHAFEGEREKFRSDHNIQYYAFRILWPEAAFIAAILDNFVLHSYAKNLYSSLIPEIFDKQAQSVLRNQIALIHYFQDLVWNELECIVGNKQIKSIFGEYYDLRAMHFKYPQLDGFYTQWLDLLNTKYLCSKPEKRCSYLATILTRLFSIDEDYLVLKNSIKTFADQEGIRITGVKITDFVYPDKIQW